MQELWLIVVARHLHYIKDAWHILYSFYWQYPAVWSYLHMWDNQQCIPTVG